jgi:hypothetical protein
MNDLLEALFSGAYNDLFAGGFYRDVMSVPAHVIGWMGLIVTFFIVYTQIESHRSIRAALMVGWGLRAVFCIYNTYVSTFNVDGFEAWAADLSGDSFSGIFGSLGNANSYTAFCALIYKLGGRNPFLLQDINIAMWVAFMGCIPRITGLLERPHAARPAAWLCAALPASVFFSTVILRESFCTIGVAYGCYYLLRANKFASVRDYLLSALWFTLAAVVHYGCVVLLLGLVVVALMSTRTQASGMRKIWFTGGAVVLAFGLVVLLFQFGLLERLAPRFSSEGLSVDTVGGVVEESYDRGRTDYMRGLEATSMSRLSWTAPIRFVFFLVTPFPWMIRKVIDLVAFFDAIAYIVGIYWIWRARTHVRRHAGMMSVLLCCTLGLFVFAMGTFNFGTAVRHRAKFFPVVMALACVAHEMTRSEREGRFMEKGRLHHGGIGRRRLVGPMPLPNSRKG